MNCSGNTLHRNIAPTRHAALCGEELWCQVLRSPPARSRRHAAVVSFRNDAPFSCSWATPKPVRLRIFLDPTRQCASLRKQQPTRHAFATGLGGDPHPHHNLFAHIARAGRCLVSHITVQCDFRNQFIYDWGHARLRDLRTLNTQQLVAPRPLHHAASARVYCRPEIILPSSFTLREHHVGMPSRPTIERLLASDPGTKAGPFPAPAGADANPPEPLTVSGNSGATRLRPDSVTRESSNVQRHGKIIDDEREVALPAYASGTSRPRLTTHSRQMETAHGYRSTPAGQRR